MSVEIFSMPLAANESREVDVTGEYFELRNAVQPVALIELLDRSGGVRSRLKDPEQSDYVRPGPYEKIRVTNGPSAQTVRFFYGSGDAGSRRTSGVVEVIDGGKARTEAGVVYGARINVNFVAGNYSTAQLWNPPGSGRRLVIGNFYAFSSGAAASALVGITATKCTGGMVAAPVNKLPGGPASVAECWYQRQAGVFAPANWFATAYNGVPIIDREPVIVPPGYGLVFNADDIAATVLGGAHFYEENV